MKRQYPHMTIMTIEKYNRKTVSFTLEYHALELEGKRHTPWCATCENTVISLIRYMLFIHILRRVRFQILHKNYVLRRKLILMIIYK